MIIVEILNFTTVEAFVNEAPYAFSALPGGLELASYWTSTFGAPDDSRDITIVVQQFVRDYAVEYNLVGSEQECIDLEQSFYWDQGNQKLWVHFEHDVEIIDSIFQYSSFFGFTDDELIYIDDQEYLPLLKSFPSIKQKQDLINYDRLAFITGSIKLNNTDAILDDFIENKVYGNDVFLYYINDEDIVDGDSARTNLRALAAFYVEDYNISLQDIITKLQDKRKAQSATVARDLFTSTDYPNIDDDVSGLSIPVAYGKLREIPAYPTNGSLMSGNVDFRAYLEGTNLGTVQVLIDDVWTTKTPSTSDATNGTFTLLEADARETSGAIREVKLVNPIGVVNTYAADVIQYLNERYLGIPFTDSFYDTTEWNSEKTQLSEIGVLFEEEIELFEAIRQIQNGSNIGFRYEINATGKRTIRIDDETRSQAFRIPNTDIRNIDKLPVKTDSNNLYSDIRVKYSKSYVSGRYLSVSNNDNETQVLQDFKQTRRLTTETFLVNQSDAESRASLESDKFATIPSIATIEVMGATKEDMDTYMQARIFDIIQLELTPGEEVDVDSSTITGRQYYGIVSGKIIGVNPKPDKKINTLEVKLLL